MKYPREALSQRDFAHQLRELIDRVRRLEDVCDGTPEAIAKHLSAAAILNAMLDLHPHAVESSHVLHNIGRARRAWLAEHQRARAGASASST